jgi:hypothetical protein
MEGRLRKSQMMLPAGCGINKLTEGYVSIPNSFKTASHYQFHGSHEVISQEGG